jgi:vitamin B12 transporter
MVLVLALIFNLWASPYETTVSANRMLKNPTTSQVIVIDQNKIKNYQTLDQVLLTIPELNMNRTGALGSQTSLSFRGQKLSHVLFLIDGIPVNDPSTVDRQFNPAFLDLKSIERIEIIKGAQSVLYGSQSIAGVINLITKRGGRDEITVDQDVGSYQTFRSQVAKTNEHYFVSFEADSSDGFSHLKDGEEKDGYENSILNFNYYKPNFQFLLKSGNSTNEEDGGEIDNDDYTKTIFDVMFFKFKFNFAHGSLNWQPSYYAQRRRTFAGSDVYHFTGRTWRNDLFYHTQIKSISMIVGTTYELEGFVADSFNQSNITNSFYTSFNYDKNKNLADLGVRQDQHQWAGDVVTYQLGIGRRISTSKLSLAQKTAFKAPTLYQLYAQETPSGKVGNENLEAEKAKSYELNFEKQNLRSSLYIIEQEDLIGFNEDKGFENFQKTTTRGFDLFKNYQYEFMEVGFGGTILWWNKESQIKKQPQQKYNFMTTYKFNDRYHLNLTGTWIGKKEDQGHDIKAYDLWDVSLTRNFTQGSIQLAFNNIFNREYVESYGFNTPGQNFNLNFRWAF